MDKTNENEVPEEDVAEEDAATEEEAAEDGADAEEDAGANDEPGDEDAGEDPQILKERLRIAEQKADRYRAERDRLKERKDGSRTVPESESKQEAAGDYPRLYLVAAGYRDRQEQEEFMAASKRMGISIEEATEDEYVLAKIERMRRAKRAAGAAARPSSGSAPAKRGVDYYIQKGTLPTEPKMLEAVQEELARRSGGHHYSR